MTKLRLLRYVLLYDDCITNDEKTTTKEASESPRKGKAVAFTQTIQIATVNSDSNLASSSSTSSNTYYATPNSDDIRQRHLQVVRKVSSSESLSPPTSSGNDSSDYASSEEDIGYFNYKAVRSSRNQQEELAPPAEGLYMTSRYTHVQDSSGHYIITGREGTLTRCEDEVFCKFQQINNVNVIVYFSLYIALEQCNVSVLWSLWRSTMLPATLL